MIFTDYEVELINGIIDEELGTESKVLRDFHEKELSIEDIKLLNELMDKRKGKSTEIFMKAVGTYKQGEDNTEYEMIVKDKQFEGSVMKYLSQKLDSLESKLRRNYHESLRSTKLIIDDLPLMLSEDDGGCIMNLVDATFIDGKAFLIVEMGLKDSNEKIKVKIEMPDNEIVENWVRQLIFFVDKPCQIKLGKNPIGSLYATVL